MRAENAAWHHGSQALWEKECSAVMKKSKMRDLFQLALFEK
jgi:hypothetical protein